MRPLRRRASLVLCLLLTCAGCVSARTEAPRPPGDAGSGVQGPPPARVDAGQPCRVPPCPCQPDEMSCCGVCIPRSEGRCPENIHCPATAPTE
jgi:hypothetical protein